MVRRLPPLNALRAFEAAARLGSFSRAAEELHVTPAAISHQVKGLEEFLGVALFVRLARGLRLTDEGRAFLPELTRGFDHLARAGERLRDRGIEGLLTVSVVPSFAQRWLIPRLPGFRALYPDIDIRFELTPKLADFIDDGVDVGVRYGFGSYPGLRSLRFLEEDVVPVCNPTLLSGPRPLRQWEDLRTHTLIHGYTDLIPEAWISWAPWLKWARVSGIEPTRGLHFNDGAVALQAAVDGLGVAIGRTALVSNDLRDGRLVEPFPGARRPADFAYYVVAPEATADQPKVRAFMDWVVETGTQWMAATCTR